MAVIRFFIGENSFEMQRAVNDLIIAFDGAAEKVDGSQLELRDLPNLLMATTLFADKRLVIIKGLSENSSVWQQLPDWLDRVSSEIDLVLVEPKPDKRTTTFKALKVASELREFAVWTDRDIQKAEMWVASEAKQYGLALDKKSIQQIVARAGVDQWQLSSALEKLSLLDEVTPQVIQDTIDSLPTENVFNLFEAALRGNRAQVHDMIRTLELGEDAYKLFALLSSQAFQLAVIHSAGSSDNPAKDFGIHPFVVGKLAAHANKLHKKDIQRIIKAFADADGDIKLSKADPWLLIERALLQVAS